MSESVSENLAPEDMVRATLEMYLKLDVVEKAMTTPLPTQDGKNLEEIAAEDPEKALGLANMFFSWQDVQK